MTSIRIQGSATAEPRRHGDTELHGELHGCTWHELGPSWLIPAGEGRVFRVGGRDVAVFRTRAGELYATQAACPHRGGPLADGIVGGSTVVCPLHAMKFDLASGAAVGHACGALATFPVEASETGSILLALGARLSAVSDCVAESRELTAESVPT